MNGEEGSGSDKSGEGDEDGANDKKKTTIMHFKRKGKDGMNMRKIRAGRTGNLAGFGDEEYSGDSEDS